MKHEIDRSLLKDVFSEAAPTDLRESMLGQSLRQVHRRRVTRLLSRAVTVCFLLITVVFLAYQIKQPLPPVALNPVILPVNKTYTLIRTYPFSETATITTFPFTSDKTVAAITFQIVHTVPNHYRSITDEELLLRLSPRACALIQTGPNEEKLVFINRIETNGFPVN